MREPRSLAQINELQPNRVQTAQSLARLCARICARTSDILLVNRECWDFALKGRFTLVKWLFFETQSDDLKAMISQSQVWRVTSAAEVSAGQAYARASI